MNEKEVIYRIGENQLEFGQNNKGTWYCKTVSINCYSIRDSIPLIDTAMSEIEKILEKHNSGKSGKEK